MLLSCSRSGNCKQGSQGSGFMPNVAEDKDRHKGSGNNWTNEKTFNLLFQIPGSYIYSLTP